MNPWQLCHLDHRKRIVRMSGHVLKGLTLSSSNYWHGSLNFECLSVPIFKDIVKQINCPK
jgi:hypothetical protein